MSKHGPLFDTFRADAPNPNGPYADQGYRPSSAPDTLQDDTTRYEASTTGHGVHWDEWHDMPVMPHGPRYDSDFAMPAARGGEHGTWFDVFRGGRTEVKAIIAGLDVQAEVINCTPDYAVVRDRTGHEHEVYLSQIQGYRKAQPGSLNRPTPSAMGGDRGHVTDADYQDAAHREPDAAQAHANGGHLRKTADDGDDVAKRVAYAVHHGKLKIGPYCGPCARATAPNLIGGVAKVHTAKTPGAARPCANCGTPVTSKVSKSLDEVLDVAKAMTERPPLARAQFHHQRGLNAQAKAYRAGYPSSSVGQDHMADATHHFAQAARYYGEHTGGAPMTHSFKTVDEARAHVEAVAKSIDASETALQGASSTAKTVGHRSACPRGGSAPCGAEQGGKCSMCGVEVEDHRAIGKADSLSTVLDVLKGMRS